MKNTWEYRKLKPLSAITNPEKAAWRMDWTKYFGTTILVRKGPGGWMSKNGLMWSDTWFETKETLIRKYADLKSRR
jgi:hypothetical protein